MGKGDLKVGKRIDIGGVSAPVIHAMVGSISLVWPWEVMLFRIWPRLFIISKNHYSTKPMAILSFSTPLLVVGRSTYGYQFALIFTKVRGLFRLEDT
jgi:hypothetical protein